MAAPEYVPVLPQDRPRRPEELPPPDRWVAERPGDVVSRSGVQPRGPRFGTPGPDQGYALKLVKGFRSRIRLSAGESVDDAEAGCVAVAMKRSGLFGRAPVVYDLEFAFGLWGFLDERPPPHLVAFRKQLFEAAAHHYWDQRDICDRVSEVTLRLTPAQVRQRLADWRSLIRAT